MIETFFGLARLGTQNGRHAAYVIALTAPEFSDIVVFPFSTTVVQRGPSGALAPVARWLGYVRRYPQLSRIVMAPRT